jgi:tetratricopeptide (TPR) repeat protein
LPKDIARRELPSDEEGFRRAVSMAYVKRAQALLRARRIAEARSWLESAVAFDARNPYAYHLLGLLAYDERDATQAEALFQKARECYRNADDWEVECNLLLGVSAERQKHWFVAKRAFETVLARVPGHPRAKRGYANAVRHLARKGLREAQDADS